MKVKKVISAMIFLIMVFILTGGPVNKASPQNIDLIPSGINNAFMLLWESKRQAKENSVIADVVITNLTGTWFQVELKSDAWQHNVVVNEKQIPLVFLMGPYQEKTFKDIEFFDTQALWFDARRDIEKAPAAFAMLSIDMICRGLFSTDFSPEQFKELLVNTTIEGFEAAGEALGNDTAASLIACITAVVTDDTKEAVESFAKFVFSLKDTKKEIWQFIKAVYGEKNSILKAANATKGPAGIIALIDLSRKLNLMAILADATLRAPQDDQVWLTAKSNLPKQPQLKITMPLRFAPAASTYYVDDMITANFEIDNEGLKTITLKQVLVGGRGPGGDNDVQDFTPAMNVIIKPVTCYQYQGTLKLTKPGEYHFFCAYQESNGQWHPSIDLGPGLTDADRVQDIEVNQLTSSTSFKASDKVKVVSQLGLWLRSSPKVINEEPHNKISPKTMPQNTELIIVSHSDNGLASDGYYWWLVQYKEQQGWCAEANYRRTDVFLSLIPMVIPPGKPGKPQHIDS